MAEIKEYIYESEKMFERFEIEQRNGADVTILLFEGVGFNKDFFPFLTDFKQRADAFNIFLIILVIAKRRDPIL